jgi:inorganic pyrophosphatase
MLELPSAFAHKDTIHVIIETPKGSRNKYCFDEKTGFFKLKKILPTGMAFPMDFGFIPQTKGDDGYPLDVLIIMEKHTYPGCLLECRILGIIEATQKEKGKKMIRNDRIVAFPIDDLEHYKFETLKDIDQDMLEEVGDFFKYYNRIEDKVFKVIGCKGPHTAIKLIKKSIE